MTSKYQLEHLTRFAAGLAKCVKCGFCMSFCPVYRERRNETSVARGKNKLLSGLVSGDLTFSQQMSNCINECTLCRTCTENCPTEAPLSALIVAARADKIINIKISLAHRIIYRWLLPRRILFGRVVRMAYWLQKIFKIQAQGTIRHLSFFLHALRERKHIPQIAPKFLRQSIPEIRRPVGANTKKHARVGYFTGCMTEYIYPDLGKKIINFLANNGLTVVTPRAQICCGAPVFLGAGDFATGRRFADVNVKAFQGLDYIITDCATCASALKDYSVYLADTDQRQQDYLNFGKRVKDITEYLVDILGPFPAGYPVRSEFKDKTITWHDPCHLNRYLGVKRQPRQVLKSLSDIKYTEMLNADSCCGMAGSFAIRSADLSIKMADRKMTAIRKSGADIIVTACPGCRVQLSDAVQRHGTSQRVLHIMELLDG